MKLVLLCAALAVTVLAAADKSPFAGTWQAETDGQTSIELKLHENGSGKFGGKVTFFLLTRGPGGHLRTEDKTEADLDNVRLEGNALLFELQPDHKFKVELAGLKELVLTKLGENPPAAPVHLEKRGK